MQRACARRCNAKVRRHPSIGIHLQRWQWKNGLLDRGLGPGFKAAIEKADVTRQTLGVGVCGNDNHCHAGPAPRQTCDRKRL